MTDYRAHAGDTVALSNSARVADGGVATPITNVALEIYDVDSNLLDTLPLNDSPVGLMAAEVEAPAIPEGQPFLRWATTFRFTDDEGDVNRTPPDFITVVPENITLGQTWITAAEIFEQDGVEVTEQDVSRAMRIVSRVSKTDYSMYDEFAAATDSDDLEELREAVSAQAQYYATIRENKLGGILARREVIESETDSNVGFAIKFRAPAAGGAYNELCGAAMAAIRRLSKFNDSDLQVVAQLVSASPNEFIDLPMLRRMDEDVAVDVWPF